MFRSLLIVVALSYYNTMAGTNRYARCAEPAAPCWDPSREKNTFFTLSDLPPLPAVENVTLNLSDTLQLDRRIHDFKDCRPKNYTLYLKPREEHLVFHPSTVTLRRCHTGYEDWECRASSSSSKSVTFEAWTHTASGNWKKYNVKVTFQEDTGCESIKEQ